jgi:transposase
MNAYLGIDIAKLTFTAVLRHNRQTSDVLKFDNHLNGFKKMAHYLAKRKIKQLHVCMEATGTYWEACALWMHDQGYQVTVANPKQIKKFGEVKLNRHKTDAIDAGLIAEYCEKMEPRLWTPPSAARRSLREMHRYWIALQEEHTRILNRLQSGLRDETVIALENNRLTFVAHHLDQLLQKMKELVEADEELAREFSLLQTIKGIGELTALVILAELPPYFFFEDSGQVAAYSGLIPAHKQSGTSVNKRSNLSKIGNPHLRAALYFPAMSAMQHNPLVRNLVTRLRERGKKKMTVLAAAMRKLLELAWGVLKSGVPFDPNYGSVGKELAPLSEA